MVSPYDIEDIFPNDPASVRLPRQQAGSTAQNLAVTLLADYTLSTRAWLPSASIVALLEEAGVGSGAARTAISRLFRAGILESSRDGRYSSYRLTTAAAANLSAGGAWIARFANRVEPWDGYWTLVSFSFPQDERGRRRTLRGQLRWLGFAPLYDALWVSPDAPNPVVKERLTTTTLGTMTMFRARQVDLATPASRNPIDAWDVAAIARRYHTFIRHWEPMLPRIRAGEVSGAAAVQARTEIMDAYRQFPIVDPELPIELMPANWPRAQARELFVTVYDRLAAPAQDHVRTLVTRFSDVPSSEIRAHSTAEMAEAADAS
ncbi:PaaX family transcriptional regulator C-terminal domain-containing protein [Actinoplanes oblitus]|uniref:PaaX family transcriptional regulator C-terminal domain-containing protein n=1 Tax=Actinoplanes oblitus TaxID=3040509 RepID=A0ABY8WQU8_9ACTN|nr:PaaX family transcriptional regulator C-terminal domain-containing protein [Actinoplanes oblitus]WIN00267.1 PaaX family transcriptional regulator C-terminal domain-containing protein [Actinoplanes oblitus]